MIRRTSSRSRWSIHVLHAVAVGCWLCVPAAADIISFFDENGNNSAVNTDTGFTLSAPFDLRADTTGPGGLSSALTYRFGLSTGTVSGDILIQENGITSDVVRFNQVVLNPATPDITVSWLVFYSDKSDGSDSLADTGLPTALYANNVTILEGDDGAFYTPTAGQPGFNASLQTQQHIHFISDAPAPEPASWTLMLGGIAALVSASIHQRQRGPDYLYKGDN